MLDWQWEVWLWAGRERGWFVWDRYLDRESADKAARVLVDCNLGRESLVQPAGAPAPEPPEQAQRGTPAPSARRRGKAAVGQPRTCVTCNKVFTPKRRDRTFANCSRACGNARGRQTLLERIRRQQEAKEKEGSTA